MKKENEEMAGNIANELNKLNRYQMLCSDALTKFSETNLLLLNDSEMKKIDVILKRMFQAERDYLWESPDDYFALYGK